MSDRAANSLLEVIRSARATRRICARLMQSVQPVQAALRRVTHFDEVGYGRAVFNHARRL
jgi:hypothetical protein